MILVQSKYNNRLCYWMSYGIFSKEEGAEIDHEMLHQIRGGTSNALGYLRRVVSRKLAREKARPPAVGHQEHRRDDPKPGNVAKGEEPGAVFRRAASEGGIAGPDLDAVERTRGTVPYPLLSDFTHEQIKEGRKGKELKDDLLAFIKLLFIKVFKTRK